MLRKTNMGGFRAFFSFCQTLPIHAGPFGAPTGNGRYKKAKIILTYLPGVAY
jgi:hypothetical protein